MRPGLHYVLTIASALSIVSSLIGAQTSTLGGMPTSGVSPGLVSAEPPGSSYIHRRKTRVQEYGQELVSDFRGYAAAQGDVRGPVKASTYGSDLTGTNDSTAAINNCLNAARAGGTCSIDPGGIVKVLGNIVIPAQTTLDCGTTFTDGNSLSSAPAIRMDRGHSILYAGDNAAVHNCLIVPEGLTFPQPSSEDWIGTAINTQGTASPEIVNTEIVGFASCVNAYGSGRALIYRVYMDCSGTANGGSLVTGNEVDSGFLLNVKLQVIGTAATCPSRVRQGSGWYWHDDLSGGFFVDNVVSQDFQIADYNFVNVNNLLAGKLWADFDSGDGCMRGASVGMLWNAVNNVHLSHLDLNGPQTGLSIEGNGQNATNTIDDLMLNAIGQDCILVTAAGHLNIGSLHTNQAESNNCGRYAINYNDKLSASFVSVTKGTLVGVNRGASPYVYTAHNTSPGWQLQLGNIITDLPPGSALLGGPVLPGPAGVPSAGTLALKPGQCSFMCTVYGTANITRITGVSPGDIITLEFQGALTVTNGNNLRLAGNANFRTQPGSLLRLICNSLNGTAVVCIEMSRSS